MHLSFLHTFSWCVSSLVSVLNNVPLGLPTWLSGKESPCNIGDVVQFLGLKDSMEKEMATLSSILAWTTPWTEESGGLQSMESQRVGPN